MIWLTWRQLRAQLVAVYVLVATACLVLLVSGPRIAALARKKVDVYDALTSGDRFVYYAGIAVLAVAPAVIGIFWGAPLVARELEGGTHRLTWNQSVTRSTWLAVKLASSLCAAALAVGLLSAAVTWWAKPLDGATGNQRGSLYPHLTPISFAMRGIVPIGYAVFALLLGTACGLLLRRSIPAMALTLAIYVVVQVAVPLWVRPHLLPPTVASVTISLSTLDALGSTGSGPVQVRLHTADRDDWILSNQTVDGAGHPVALPSWFRGCTPPPSSAASSSTRRNADAVGLDTCFRRLTSAGYHQRVVYQPASRFWPLQWAETGLYLVVSALLAAFSFWWTRSRLT
jgi:hypothetical protein